MESTSNNGETSDHWEWPPVKPERTAVQIAFIQFKERLILLLEDFISQQKPQPTEDLRIRREDFFNKRMLQITRSKSQDLLIEVNKDIDDLFPELQLFSFAYGKVEGFSAEAAITRKVDPLHIANALNTIPKDTDLVVLANSLVHRKLVELIPHTKQTTIDESEVQYCESEAESPLIHTALKKLYWTIIERKLNYNPPGTPESLPDTDVENLG